MSDYTQIWGYPVPTELRPFDRETDDGHEAFSAINIARAEEAMARDIERMRILESQGQADGRDGLAAVGS